MVWMPKNRPQSEAAQQAAEAIKELFVEEEEKKEEESRDIEAEDSKVTLTYDKEWIVILKLAQDKIPLEYDAPHFQTPLISLSQADL